MVREGEEVDYEFNKAISQTISRAAGQEHMVTRGFMEETERPDLLKERDCSLVERSGNSVHVASMNDL